MCTRTCAPYTQTHPPPSHAHVRFPAHVDTLPARTRVYPVHTHAHAGTWARTADKRAPPMLRCRSPPHMHPAALTQGPRSHTPRGQCGVGTARLSPRVGRGLWAVPQLAPRGWAQQLAVLCQSLALCSALPRDCTFAVGCPNASRSRVLCGAPAVPQAWGALSQLPAALLTASPGCWPHSSSAAGIRFLSHRPAPAPWAPGSSRAGRSMPPHPLLFLKSRGHRLAAPHCHQRPQRWAP